MRVQITPSKTYATEANVEKAIAAKGFENLRWVMMRTADGRFYPLFIGEVACHAGVHFHFCVTN